MDSPAPFMPVPQPACLQISAEQEEQLRRKIVAEAMSWVGTPYAQQGDVKQGAVDCSMLLVRCWVDTGVFQPFDPRPYPPMWHLHRSEERYLGWMEALAVEVQEPRPGDVAIFRFGRCFSHGGIVTAPGVLCNASAIHKKCTLNDMSEAWLAYINPRARPPVARPRRFFDVFARLRA
jgi:hypothetical protein